MCVSSVRASHLIPLFTAVLLSSDTQQRFFDDFSTSTGTPMGLCTHTSTAFLPLGLPSPRKRTYSYTRRRPHSVRLSSHPTNYLQVLIPLCRLSTRGQRRLHCAVLPKTNRRGLEALRRSQACTQVDCVAHAPISRKMPVSAASSTSGTKRRSGAPVRVIQ